MSGDLTDCSAGGMLKAQREDLQAEINSLLSEKAAMTAKIEELDAALAEADRRAGAAERRLADANDSISRRQQWLRKAKEERGYPSHISFDVVWKETCAAADAWKGSKS